MDFLGLRTLTVVENAVNEIKRIYGIDVDIDNLEDDDPKVYELISRGKDRRRIPVGKRRNEAVYEGTEAYKA